MNNNSEQFQKSIGFSIIRIAKVKSYYKTEDHKETRGNELLLGKQDPSKQQRTPPDIVKLIWENRAPSTLTLDKFRKGIPESWEDQRKLFLS